MFDVDVDVDVDGGDGGGDGDCSRWWFVGLGSRWGCGLRGGGLQLQRAVAGGRMQIRDQMQIEDIL